MPTSQARILAEHKDVAGQTVTVRRLPEKSQESGKGQRDTAGGSGAVSRPAGFTALDALESEHYPTETGGNNAPPKMRP